ncbi:TPA: hypothetical protein HA265_05535 [Candidatus Woesearchaeota archaeon]|nr:hypothetical protein [Candidatus Woesearchaeota archaeon]
MKRHRFGVFIYVMCFIFGALLMFLFMGFSAGMFNSLDPIAGGVADFCISECSSALGQSATAVPTYDKASQSFFCDCFGSGDLHAKIGPFTLQPSS